MSFKKLSRSASLEDVLSFDDGSGGGEGQRAAIAVITANIHFHFTAQSMFMLGLTVWLSMIPR